MFKLPGSLGVLAAVSLLTAAPARADKGTLTVWINGDKAYNGLAKVV